MLSRALLAATVVLGLCLLPFVSGLVGALILYVLLVPVHRRLARVLPARVSAFALTIAAAVTLLVPGTWLATSILGEATEALAGLQQGSIVDWIARVAGDDSRIASGITALATNSVAWLSGRAFALFGSATSTLLNGVIALFGAYYLLADGNDLLPRARRLLPISDEAATHLAERFVAVTEALMLGTFLTAILQGVIVGVAFALTGLRPAMLWGFVTACVSVLPVFGSAIVWLPGAIVLAVQHHLGQAVVLAVIGAGLASNLDNVVRLFVYRRVSDIHPMLTLVGAFAGIRLFGIVGALLGPLALSFFIELLKFAEASREPELANIGV
jgi:predicted PurR-regulated permease PerM